MPGATSAADGGPASVGRYGIESKLLVAGAAFAATRTKRRPDVADVAPA
jgi:hypothetical protein